MRPWFTSSRVNEDGFGAIPSLESTIEISISVSFYQRIWRYINFYLYLLYCRVSKIILDIPEVYLISNILDGVSILCGISK